MHVCRTFGRVLAQTFDPGAQGGESRALPVSRGAQATEVGEQRVEHAERLLDVGQAEEEVVLESRPWIAAVRLAERRAAERAHREETTVEYQLPAPVAAFHEVRLGPYFYVGATLGLGLVIQKTGLSDGLGGLVRAAFDTIDGDRATVAVMVNEWNLFVQYPRFAYLRDFEEETERLWVDVLERGIGSGAFREDLDPRLFYRLVRDSIWVSVRWYRANGPGTAEEVADAYVDVWLGGIAAKGA